MLRQLGLLAALLCTAIGLGGSRLATAAANDGAIPALIEQAQAGDLLFIGDTNGWADIGAVLSDTDKRYGHVGIVVLTEQGLEVIEAGGHPIAREAIVRRVPLSQFVHSAGNVGLLRPALSNDQRDRFIDHAQIMANDAVPFDRHFDMTTAAAVYCTELVWRSLSAALSADAIPEKTVAHGHVYITIEDVLNAPHLDVIGHVSIGS